MSCLTRDQKPPAPRIVKVPLPEFGNGCYVNVRGFTVLEKSRFEKSTTGPDGKPIDRLRERLMIAVCRDDAGQPVFKPEDLISLSEWPSEAADRVVDVAMTVSGMRITSVEDIVKNSDGTTDDAPH